MIGLAETAGVDIPAHIDPSRVVDFDFFHDPRYARTPNPYDALIGLRDEVGLGIYWSPRNGGHWFITHHEFLVEARRKPESFYRVHAPVPPGAVAPGGLLPPRRARPP